jgi:GNAT superfamily N-acetyltransferase
VTTEQTVGARQPVHRSSASGATHTSDGRTTTSAWSRLGRRVVERHVVDVFERRLDVPVPQYPTADAVQLHRLAPDTDPQPAAIPVTHRDALHANLRRGDSGWYAVVDGRFAGWLWVSRLSHLDRWSGLRIRLRPDEAYTYGWEVLPEFRKDGIAAALMARLLTELQEAGEVRRVYGWADRDNRNSQFQLRLLFGFSPTQEVQRMRVLDRWGRAIRGSEKPATGPVSCSSRRRDV